MIRCYRFVPAECAGIGLFLPDITGCSCRLVGIVWPNTKPTGRTQEDSRYNSARDKEEPTSVRDGGVIGDGECDYGGDGVGVGWHLEPWLARLSKASRHSQASVR